MNNASVPRFTRLIRLIGLVLSIALWAAIAVAPAQAQSLRDMALLEATMQGVAEAGQQVLHRLTQGRQGAASRVVLPEASAAGLGNEAA